MPNITGTGRLPDNSGPLVGAWRLGIYSSNGIGFPAEAGTFFAQTVAKNVDQTGALSWTGLEATTDDWWYYAIFEPTDKRQHKLGPYVFELTANKTWKDIIETPSLVPITPAEVTRALAAQTAAEAARDLAQSARDDAEDARDAALAVPTTTDTLMKGVDANSASQFRVQQDARLTAAIGTVGAPLFVAEGSAFADIGKQAGVDSSGATECAAAINTALAAIAAFGGRAYARGTFKIASTVSIVGDCDLGDATFSYTGTTGTAVLVGSATSGTVVNRLRGRLPKVIAAAKTVTGWAQVAGTIGVDVSNLQSSASLEIPHVKNFEIGLRIYGKGTGNVHNNLFLGHFENNKINQYIDASSTGWANQNMYYGGRFSHTSSEGTNVAGTRHIEMAVTTQATNTHTWIGTSLEADTAEFHAVIAGQYNLLENCRWEVTGGARVKWASNSSNNLIFGGYQAASIVETFAAGAASSNRVWTATRSYMAGSGGTSGVLVGENASSSANPFLVIQEAGARVAGSSPATAYAVSLGAQSFGMKRAADTADRIKLDPVNGRVYLGSGAATPVMYFGNVSTTGIKLDGGHLYFNADNTSDIGAATLRPRNIIAGTSVQVGGVSWLSGTGSPEGSKTAPAGSLYSRTDGGANTTLYVKESGSGNTGWVAK